MRPCLETLKEVTYELTIEDAIAYSRHVAQGANPHFCFTAGHEPAGRFRSPGEADMKVEYMLSREDWIEFYRYTAKNTWEQLRDQGGTLTLLIGLVAVAIMWLGAAAFLGFLAKLVFSLLDEQAAFYLGMVVASLFLVATGTAAVVGRFLESREKRDRKYGEKCVNQGVQAGYINLGTRTHLTLTSEGLCAIETVDNLSEGVTLKVRSECHISWTVVDEIETTDRHVFFKYFKGTQAWYIFVPIREFPAGATVTVSAFVEEAMRLWGTVSVKGTAGGRSTAIQTRINP